MDISVIDEVASEIKVVHIARPFNNQRAYLDESEIELYRKYWQALTDAGYEGEWNLEAFYGDHKDGLKNSMKIMNEIR